MADISKLVEYDRPHPVKIKYPNGQDSGITIDVVSVDSARVVNALRDLQAEAWKNEAVGGADAFVSMSADRERAILINCIVGWDWGDHTFEHINSDTDPTPENRAFLIDHPNAIWIKTSLAAGCAMIENFTNPLPKSARTGSKKT